jgi:hypothetical protein
MGAQIHGCPALGGRAQLHLVAAVLEGEQDFLVVEVIHEADGRASEPAQYFADLVSSR